MRGWACNQQVRKSNEKKMLDSNLERLHSKKKRQGCEHVRQDNEHSRLVSEQERLETNCAESSTVQKVGENLCLWLGAPQSQASEKVCLSISS